MGLISIIIVASLLSAHIFVSFCICSGGVTVHVGAADVSATVGGTVDGGDVAAGVLTVDLSGAVPSFRLAFMITRSVAPSTAAGGTASGGTFTRGAVGVDAAAIFATAGGAAAEGATDGGAASDSAVNSNAANEGAYDGGAAAEGILAFSLISSLAAGSHVSRPIGQSQVVCCSSLFVLVSISIVIVACISLMTLSFSFVCT